MASATPAKAGFAPGGHSSPSLKARGGMADLMKVIQKALTGALFVLFLIHTISSSLQR